MNSKDYKKLVLEKLLKKYHNRMAKNISTSRRIILRPQEIYKNYHDNNADISEKQRLEEAVKALAELGMVTVDYLKFSADMEKIYLCEEHMDVVYGYLRDVYGIVQQNVLSEKLRQILQQYQPSGELVKYYAACIQAQMEDPRQSLDVSGIRANLQLLDFLEQNKEELYVRELSVLVYGDSKWFEQNNYEEICNIIRETLQMPGKETLGNDEILARYHVFPVEQEVMVKGGWKIAWDGYELETARLDGGIAISSSDIRNIRRITIQAKGLMTIENKTSYQRMNSRGTAIMYLGGFASRPQIDFLRKVIADNPGICYEHFGDIDAGGFLIHRHLCRATGKDFRLYGMGIEQLADERFCKCLKPLTDNDLSRLESLAEEETYREVVSYMRERSVKLEQEIVSYYLDAGRSKR